MKCIDALQYHKITHVGTSSNLLYPSKAVVVLQVSHMKGVVVIGLGL